VRSRCGAVRALHDEARFAPEKALARIRERR
jgi:hypothetical protein